MSNGSGNSGLIGSGSFGWSSFGSTVDDDGGSAAPNASQGEFSSRPGVPPRTVQFCMGYAGLGGAHTAMPGGRAPQARVVRSFSPQVVGLGGGSVVMQWLPHAESAVAPTQRVSEPVIRRNPEQEKFVELMGPVCTRTISDDDLRQFYFVLRERMNSYIPNDSMTMNTNGPSGSDLNKAVEYLVECLIGGTEYTEEDFANKLDMDLRTLTDEGREELPGIIIEKIESLVFEAPDKMMQSFNASHAGTDEGETGSFDLDGGDDSDNDLDSLAESLADLVAGDNRKDSADALAESAS